MTAASEIIRKYRTAIQRLIVFGGTLRPKGGTLRQEEHAVEGRQRLEQMLYALLRVRALQRQLAVLDADKAKWAASPDDRTLKAWRARHGRIVVQMLFSW